MGRLHGSAAAVIAGLGGLAIATGCQTQKTTLRSAMVPARTPAPVRSPASTDPYAGVRVLGSVPYDDRTLPVVSPDGHFVATQVGPAVAWETLLAQAAAPAPGGGCGIEIYRCDPHTEVAVLQARSEPGLLLGRGADAAGLLVESPRDDGSRWIGRLPWIGGPVEWLVGGAEVNAFASLGADGRLAWSRRGVDDTHFDLVVRHGEAEWTLDAGDGDWLMPAWSEQPDGLFALHLAGGRLDLVFMNAQSADTARLATLRLPVAQQMSARDAYQMLASRAGAVGAPPLGSVHLFFFHPVAARMALWRPMDSPGAAVVLEAGSVAAELDGSGFVIVTTSDRLILQDPVHGTARTILPGTLVPRPTADPRWPWVLLLPRRGQIGLLGLRLESGSVPQNPGFSGSSSRTTSASR